MNHGFITMNEKQSYNSVFGENLMNNLKLKLGLSTQLEEEWLVVFILQGILFTDSRHRVRQKTAITISWF